MAFDFPNAPTTGQVFNNYTWDGEKWAVTSIYNPVDAGAVRFDKAQGLTINQMSQGRANISVTKKNYIINGAMMISQENGTTVVPGEPGRYPADMFSVAGTRILTAYTAQAQTGTPGGSAYRINLTSGQVYTPVVNVDALSIQHSIEGNRYVDLWQSVPKTITLRFGVNATKAGTYCVSFRNFNGTRSYVAEYTISAGEAGTDVVKTVTLPATDGTTFEYGVAAGLIIDWSVLCGTTYQTATPNTWLNGNYMATANQTNWSNVSGNVFSLFDVGLYEGSVAPPFQLPDYISELALCKRYFELIGAGVGGAFTNTSNVGIYTVFPVEKRAVPTVSLTTVSPTVLELATAVRTGSGSTITLGTPTAKGSDFNVGGFSGATQLRQCVMLGDYIKLNARL